MNNEFEGSKLLHDRSELIAITQRVAAEAKQKEKMDNSADVEVKEDGLQVQEE